VLAPVTGRPFITYLLDQLAEAGAGVVTLATGYLAGHVRDALGSTYAGMALAYSVEEQPLGTGGALRLVAGECAEDLILALNGDSYIHADLGTFVEWHRNSRYDASLMLAHVEDVSRFGSVSVGEGDRVLGFREKAVVASSGWINAGVYLFPRSWLLEVPKGARISLEYDLLPGWLPRGIGALPVKAPFLDIGTPESFARAAQFIKSVRRTPSQGATPSSTAMAR
jgi:NDP-sugar pyrophosphorylase family protein